MKRLSWLIVLSVLPTLAACDKRSGAQGGADLGSPPGGDSPDLGSSDDLGGPGDAPDLSPPNGGGPDLGQPPPPPKWQSGFNLPGLSGGRGTQVFAVARGANGHFFAGGHFFDAAGTTVSNVVEWTGSGWSALGAGLADDVAALLVGPDGMLYAGTFAPATTPNHLHRWDGTKWTDVAGDLSGDVRALAVQGARILVGGNFADAAGLGTARIAAYTPGTGWSAIGIAGADGAVRTILVEDAARLCVGGDFGTVDGVAAQHAACWSGTAWTQLGDGFSGSVARLIKDTAGTYYAGGQFSFQDFTSAVGVLQNGTWQSLAGGVNNGFTTEARGMAFAPDGSLIVGGDFASAGNPYVAGKSVPATNLARYDFTTGTWSEFAGGVGDAVGVYITSGGNDILVQDDGSLIVAGYFTTGNHGGIAVANIGQLKAGKWSALVNPNRHYNGISGSLNDLAVDARGAVIVGGSFSQAGQTAAPNIARFDGTTWSALGPGLNGQVNVVHLRPNGDLIAGGWFTRSGNVAMPYIARYDGLAWSPLGPALDGAVSAIAEDAQGNLYIAGSFTSAGGVALNHIARWDGSAWAPVGQGFDQNVNAITFDSHGQLIATGMFKKSGTTTLNGLASWDGTKWSGFGTGLSGAGFLWGSKLVADDQGFTVSGIFSAVDGHAAGSIARWDGAKWTDLGAGLGPYQGTMLMQSFARMGSGLYVCGIFTMPGDTKFKNLAYWDGKAWSVPAGGVDDVCSAVAVSGTRLYAGGAFLTAGGQVSTGIAALQ